MRYTRQYNPVSPLTTNNDDGGDGPLDTEYYDNEISSGRQNVIAMSRGSDMRNAPAVTENTDLVSGGRLPVLARSGNSYAEHQEEGTRDPEELIGNMSDSELAADEAALTAATKLSWPTIIFAAAAFGLVWSLHAKKR